ncbi:MAG: hypothetical protein ABIP51_05450 [Bacteroidia bacterium]
MKKIINIVTTGFIMGILMIGCNEASKKDIKDARDNIKDANKDLSEAVVAANDTAKTRAIKNWQSFKIQSDSSIAGMNRNLARLEAKIAKANKANKAKLKTDIDNTRQKFESQKEKLHQMNIEFENDMKHFDEAAVAKNESFQREFKHDMNELATAFKDLFNDNVK